MKIIFHNALLSRMDELLGNDSGRCHALLSVNIRGAGGMDSLLPRLLGVLSGSARAEDAVAVTGYERFAVLLTDCLPERGVRFARLTRAAVRMSDDLRGLPGELSCDIGAVIAGGAGTSARHALAEADRARRLSGRYGANRITWAPQIIADHNLATPALAASALGRQLLRANAMPPVGTAARLATGVLRSGKPS